VTPPPAASAGDDRPLDLVPTGGQLALEAGDEDSEVGVARAGVHLGDEKDPHAEAPAEPATCG
jgi:hypothetical protein